MRQLLSAYVVLALILSSHAQEVSTAPAARPTTLSAGDYLEIGSTTLRLGTPKGVIIPELAKAYVLERLDEQLENIRRVERNKGMKHVTAEAWALRPKTNSMSAVLGSIGFDSSGKLCWANKDWTPGAKDYSTTEIGEAIYKVIFGFVEQGNMVCFLSTDALHSTGPGGMELRTAHLTCGHRNMQIQLGWTSGLGHMTVDEGIGE
jgi:hypothetical protein